MERIVYLEPAFIEAFAIEKTQDPDPKLIEAVDRAIDQLGPDLRCVIREKYFDGLTICEIALRQDLPEKIVVRRLYEAKRQLKMMLSDFVKNRWNIEVKGMCKICRHDRRQEIDEMLINKRKDESWGRICKRIEEAVGERIYPPQVLKAHLKHIAKLRKGQKNEQ